MKRSILICLIISFTFFLIRCQKSEKTETELSESKYGSINNLEGVTSTVNEKSVQQSGLIVIIHNNTKDDFVYDSFYCVEKSEFGRWYQVPEITKNPSFNLIGYTLKANSSVEVEVDWGWLYGDLEVGNYRILKRLGDKSDYDKAHYLSAEFEIHNLTNIGGVK